jgi:hypothetical protein
MTTPTSSPAIIDTAAIAQELGCDRIMSFEVWCLLANVSVSTGKRIIKAGRGPKLTHMSERCQGVRVSHHHEWLDECSSTNNDAQTKPARRDAAGRARSTLR